MRTTLLASALLLLAGCASAPAPSEVSAVEVARVGSRLVVVRLPGKDGPSRVKGGLNPFVPQQVADEVKRYMGGAPIRVTGTLTDGYVLTYDSGTGTWLAEAPAGWSGTATSALDMADYQINNVGDISGGLSDVSLFAAAGGAGVAGKQVFIQGGAGNGGGGTAASVSVTGGGAASQAGTVTITGDTTISGVTSATVAGQVIDYAGGATLTLSEAECKGQIYRLTGSVAQTVNLPDAGAAIGTGEEGALVTFLCENTAGVTLQFGTGDTAASEVQTCASAGYWHSNRSGSTITYTRTAAATWRALHCAGTWRVDSTTTAGFAYTPTLWTSFDPESTGMGWSGANVSATGYYRHDGAEVYVRASVLCSGAPGGSATLTFVAPLGTADETAMQVGTAASTPCGRVQVLDSGVTFYQYDVWYGSGGYGSKFIIPVTLAPTFLTNTAPITFGASDEVNVEFRYPVTQ